MLRRDRRGAGGRVPPAGGRRRSAAAAAAALLFASPVRAAGPAPAHLAVALLIDTSGSMTQNDPADSRVAAARQVAAALGPGDSLGVVGFADAVRVLLPLTAMGTAPAMAAMDGALGKVGASGATDILGAITTGTAVLGADSTPADWHVLMLITDGVPDLPALSDPAAAAAYRARMEAAAQGIAARGWVLDTVGLGPGVDANELARLASLGGGQYPFAPSAADLPARLLSEFRAGQQHAASAPPPPATLPVPTAPPPVQVSLQALTVPAPTDPGDAVDLPVRAQNTGTAPVTVRISAAPLPPGWSMPSQWTVPPGNAVVALPLRAGGAGGVVIVLAAANVPAGATLEASTLRWTVRVRPPWRVFWRTHAEAIGGAGLAALGLAILAGYLGYLARVRPLRRPRGSLEIAAPGGEHLGSLRLPHRTEVRVGAAGAGRQAVRLQWISGDDLLFRIRVEMEAVHRVAWLAGLHAWARPPQAVVYAEAEWPYHLYPGPRPQRRVDLYDHTAFGAGGLTFTFRLAQGRCDGESAGTDLLRMVEPP